jgi:hypothetical protein
MRDDRHWPDVYFGRPGALTTLPYPRGGIRAPYDRLTFDFTTGSGKHRVSKLVEGSRAWELVWNALGADSYGKIEAYDRGLNGRGPWALIDPSRINLLTGNQASATSLMNTATGYSNLDNTANGVFSSNAVATHIHRAGASRSLRWQFPVTTTAFPVMELSHPYLGWKGIPAVVGKSYTFSCWIKPDGVIDSSVFLSVRIDWRDANGTVIGETSSGDSTITAWTRMIATGTAPAGTYYAVPKIVGWDFSITVGSSIYVDEMQLEMSNVVTDWVPGTGVMPVETLGLTEDIPFAASWRINPVLTVREVM